MIDLARGETHARDLATRVDVYSFALHRPRSLETQRAAIKVDLIFRLARPYETFL